MVLKNKNCENCSLYGCGKIEPVGPVPAKIMLVGEAPGATEVEQKRPFVGDSGLKLSSCLQKAGIKREDCYITNVVLCRPSLNRKPRSTEIKACSERLQEEISEVNPEVIVCLGDVAYKSLMGKLGNITDVRGTPFKLGSRTYVATFHPSTIIRGLKEETVLIKDLEVVNNLITGVTKKDVQLRSVTTGEQAQELYEFLKTVDSFSFDLETSSLDWMTAWLLCLGIGTKDVSFVIDCNEKKGTKYNNQYLNMAPWIKKIMALPCLKVAHNGKFDVKFLWQRGIQVSNFSYDTILGHHMIDENVPHKLEFLGQYYLDETRDEQELRVISGTDKDYTKAPDKLVWRHCGTDVDHTYRIFELQKKYLEEQNLYSFVTNFYTPLELILAKMEVTGVKVNKELLLEYDKKAAEEIAKAEVELALTLNDGSINLRSSQQVAQLLYKDLKLPAFYTTLSGSPSTSAKALTRLSKENDSDIARKILNYKYFTKLRSTYLAGLDGSSGLLPFIRDDGRIHFNFLAIGTVTGRLSSNSPNGQNIPGGDLINVRNIFIPDEGMDIIEADYRQVELRLVGLLSGDQKLLADMNASEELHKQLASTIFKIPFDQVTKTHTNIEKRVVFGLLYGSGVKKIREILDYEYSLDDVRTWVTSFFEAYPQVQMWRLKIIREVENKGYLSNIFGRRRHINLQSSDKHEGERQAINFPPQSGSADILNWSTVLMDKEIQDHFPEVKMLLTVHDALYFECPKSQTADFVQQVYSIMERPIPELGGVKLPVKIKVGSCWDDPNSKEIKRVH